MVNEENVNKQYGDEGNGSYVFSVPCVCVCVVYIDRNECVHVFLKRMHSDTGQLAPSSMYIVQVVVSAAEEEHSLVVPYTELQLGNSAVRT